MGRAAAQGEDKQTNLEPWFGVGLGLGWVGGGTARTFPPRHSVTAHVVLAVEYPRALLLSLLPAATRPLMRAGAGRMHVRFVGI